MTNASILVRSEPPHTDIDPEGHPDTVPEDTDFLHLLGDELRRARRLRHWTRKQLQSELTRTVALPTLASYEMGARHCSVERFVDICDALKVPPPEILANALHRVAAATPAGFLHVDLRAVVADTGRTLRVFRRWAQRRIATQPDADTDLRLDTQAVARLAELSDLDPCELVAALSAVGAVHGNGLDDTA